VVLLCDDDAYIQTLSLQCQRLGYGSKQSVILKLRRFICRLSQQLAVLVDLVVALLVHIIVKNINGIQSQYIFLKALDLILI